MMAKAKKIRVEPEADNTKSKVAATIACEPTFKAALTAQLYAPALGQELDTVAMHSKTAELAYNAKNDGLGEIEVMMAAQIYALDSIFHYTAGRAKANMGQYPHAADMYMRLALKAQTQCRSTAETLSAIKNPRAYIRQTNIAQNQQIKQTNYYRSKTMRRWTLEERARQAELIQRWQPWKQSTGAKTAEGGNVSKLNALKHGVYSAESKIELKKLRSNLREALIF